MHAWGGKFEYFREVELAAQEIGDFCKKWGRMGVWQTKEKYGTARVYCSFGLWGFHSLINPGYARNRWPSWLWKLDCDYGTRVITPFNWFIAHYQIFIYKIAYKRAIKKYPFIKKEILVCADYSEYLKKV